MPEPKEPKRTFDAHTDDALSGLRVVSQRAERAGVEKPGQQDSEPGADAVDGPKTELVTKLIRFLGNF